MTERSEVIDRTMTERAAVESPRWAFARVDYAGRRDLDELAPGIGARAFTRPERLRSATGRTLSHWAGRIAAKRAVLRLIGIPATASSLAQVEILPRPGTVCATPGRCRLGHPPAAELRGEVRRLARHAGVAAVQVSISHASGVAVAAALALVSTVEGVRR